jgi:hypothetical protein
MQRRDSTQTRQDPSQLAPFAAEFHGACGIRTNRKVVAGTVKLKHQGSGITLPVGKHVESRRRSHLGESFRDTCRSVAPITALPAGKGAVSLLVDTRAALPPDLRGDAQGSTIGSQRVRVENLQAAPMG